MVWVTQTLMCAVCINSGFIYSAVCFQPKLNTIWTLLFRVISRLPRLTHWCLTVTGGLLQVGQHRWVHCALKKQQQEHCSYLILHLHSASGVKCMFHFSGSLSTWLTLLLHILRLVCATLKSTYTSLCTERDRVRCSLELKSIPEKVCVCFSGNDTTV